MLEIAKWAGLVFLVLMTYGAFRSTPPKMPTDLPDNLCFWIGFAGCIVAIVICYVLGPGVILD
jgi:hypothetical protein